MASDIFTTIRASAGDSQKSLQWYQKQIKALQSVTPNKLMSNAPDMTTSILPGAMYMFYYDAKLKDQLPYWDRFPVVLPCRKIPNGFYGLNLHYLPYDMRFKLLKVLHDFAYDENITESTRVRLSWDVLNSSSRYRAVKPCVKMYLYSNVESRFLNIKYPDWLTASLLPVERFEKAEKSLIWRDSRKRING